VRNNSQTSGYGALFKLGTTLLPRSTAGITLFHTQSSKGVPPSVVSVRPRYWRFPEWEKTLLHLTDQTNLGEALVLKAAAFFENYRNVLDAYDDQTYTTQTRRYAFHSTYDDDSYGATVTATVATLTSHLTRLAVHFKNDIHREHDGRDAPWERYETRLSTFGIEHEYAWGPAFALVAGASYDHLRPTYANASPVRPASGAWNGHAGIRYRSEGGLELRANAARRSRFPTLKELYSEVMGKNVANPHLAAERCWNGEVGCSWSVLKDLQLSLAVFRNTVQRVILLSTLVDGSQQFRNIGSARYQGAELAARGDAGPVAFQCHYTYLDAGNTSADAPSRLLPYRPRHLMNGRLSGRCVETLSWQVGFTSSAIVHGVDMDTGAIVRLADYTLLNVRVAWRPHTALELFVRLDNALDRYYETDAGFPQAGRDLLVGFDVSL
jgi:iron complex outermembrane receptor protein